MAWVSLNNSTAGKLLHTQCNNGYYILSQRLRSLGRLLYKQADIKTNTHTTFSIVKNVMNTQSETAVKYSTAKKTIFPSRTLG